MLMMAHFSPKIIFPRPPSTTIPPHPLSLPATQAKAPPLPHVINLPKPVVDAEEENPFAHMADDEELFEVRTRHSQTPQILSHSQYVFIRFHSQKYTHNKFDFIV